jgi:hypothetical protein
MTHTAENDAPQVDYTEALDAIIAVMRVDVDRAFNARCVLAAIQRGEVPGISVIPPGGSDA